MAKIIGVTGSAGVGKDTFAQYLVTNHNYCRIALADPIKRICKEVYAFTDTQLWGASKYRNEEDIRYPRPDGSFLSARVALQICGTEFGRTCYPNTWVDKVLFDARTVLEQQFYSPPYREGDGCHLVRFWPSIYKPETGVTMGESVTREVHQPPPPPIYEGVVVPDVRFKNEMEAIRKAGGINIRLKRDLGRDPTTVGVKGHASEAEQLEVPDSYFDFVIECEEGIQQFYTQVYREIPAILTKLKEQNP